MLDTRGQDVFRALVETYLDQGEPVGSRTLARSISESISAATIRNVMQDLEFLGLLESPHVSAGRVPTELGLRMFVDGILEVEDLEKHELARIEHSLEGEARDRAAMLESAGSLLSHLTRAASIVLVPKSDAPVKAHRIRLAVLGPGTGGSRYCRRQSGKPGFPPTARLDAVFDEGGSQFPEFHLQRSDGRGPGRGRQGRDSQTKTGNR